VDVELELDVGVELEMDAEVEMFDDARIRKHQQRDHADVPELFRVLYRKSEHGDDLVADSWQVVVDSVEAVVEAVVQAVEDSVEAVVQEVEDSVHSLQLLAAPVAIDVGSLRRKNLRDPDADDCEQLRVRVVVHGVKLSQVSRPRGHRHLESRCPI
jgi:hypothetical protein